MRYLKIRPRAPEFFCVPERISAAPHDEEPPTERRPDLARAWATRMNVYVPVYEQLRGVVKR